MNTSGVGASRLPTVAIVGGGQLGYLLCKAAQSLGVRTLIVTPDADAPAIIAADDYIVADLRQPGLAREIAARANAATFELEAVPDEFLEALQREQLRISPDVAVMQLLKNKARQKKWLISEGVATADYLEITAEQAASKSFVDGVRFPFVQKAQEGGYDGYGVQVIRDETELAGLWPVASIIEAYLDDVRELAVVAARSADGQLEVYPPVELTVDRERNILDQVIAPAPLDHGMAAAAEGLARRVVSRLGGVGVFAVEMFLAGDRLLVNEISPRVHNSGHHTIESCTVSQFEQHMRAVAGLPLVAAELSASAVMQNILYEDYLAPMIAADPRVVAYADQSVWVHWYGKKAARRGRKMGHVTCIGVEPWQSRELINEILSSLVAQAGEEIP